MPDRQTDRQTMLIAKRRSDDAKNAMLENTVLEDTKSISTSPNLDRANNSLSLAKNLNIRNDAAYALRFAVVYTYILILLPKAE